MLFSIRLKELRKKKHLTQEMLSHMINVDKSAISHYEKGDKRPSMDSLRLLAKVFDVSVDYLMGNDYYEVAESDSEYGKAVLAHEEVEGIYEFRRYPRLHEELIKDPKRFVERVNMKLK